MRIERLRQAVVAAAMGLLFTAVIATPAFAQTKPFVEPPVLGQLTWGGLRFGMSVDEAKQHLAGRIQSDRKSELIVPHP